MRGAAAVLIAGTIGCHFAPVLESEARPAPALALADLVPRASVVPAEPRGRLYVHVERPDGTIERIDSNPPARVDAALYASALRETIAAAALFTLVDRLEEADFVLTVLDVRCFRRLELEKGYWMAPLWQLARAASGEPLFQGRVRAAVDARSSPGSGSAQKSDAIARLYRSNLESGVRALAAAAPPAD